MAQQARSIIRFVCSPCQTSSIQLIYYIIYSMLMWDICGGYVPWLKYLKISWVRYLQYPHCWGHTLSQWGDAIDAWTSLDNLHLLQDVLICFVSTSQVEPGAIWMCFPNHLNYLKGYDIYIYTHIHVHITGMFDCLKGLDDWTVRYLLTISNDMMDMCISIAGNKTTDQIQPAYLIYPGLLLHIASQSYHPVSFRDDFFPSLRDGRWPAGILQGWFPESSMRSIRTRFLRIAMRNMYVKIYKCM